MHIRAIALLTLSALLAALNAAAFAAAPGCPHDANGDGRVDIGDLYRLNQNPADINGDGVANAEDIACLELYLRCAEFREMPVGAGRPAGDGLAPWLVFREMTHLAGTEQTFEVDRRPSPGGPSCVGESWTLELLGTNPSLSHPVLLETRRDGFALAPAFMDQDLRSLPPGTSSPIAATVLCPGSSFELGLSWNGSSVRSDDRFRALVLRNGHNATQRATVKGVADAASRDIGGGLIDAYVDGSGVVTLPANEVLVLFELNGVDAADPAFAFDDAAVRLDLNCGGLDAGEPRLVVLRDSIGPDISMTNENFVFGVTEAGSGHNFIPVFLEPDSDTMLSSWSMILGPVFSSGFELSHFEFRLRMWVGQDTAAVHNAILASPTWGNAANFSFGTLTEVPPQWGSTRTYSAGNPLRPSFRFDFVFGQNLPELLEGNVYALMITPRRSGTGGDVGVAESTEQSPVSDRYYAPGFPGVPVVDHPNSMHSGRVAVRVVGAVD